MQHPSLATVCLTGHSLTLEQLLLVSRQSAPCIISAQALERVNAAYAVVEAVNSAQQAVYGLTTGVGAKKTLKVDDPGRARELRLLKSHCIGQGEPLPCDFVRAMLVRLMNHLLTGYVGVRPELIAHLLRALNDGIPLTVRRYGSTGTADLAQAADLALSLIERFPLAPGEGLALLNHNCASTAHAALACADLSRLANLLDVTGAMELEVIDANLTTLDPQVAIARPYPGLNTAIKRLRALLADSVLLATGSARSLQDPLTFRCLPQLSGALRDSISHLEGVLAIELNASQGNPIVVQTTPPRVISCANFEILPLAVALDQARICLASILTAAVKLLNRNFTGLSSGLAAKDGLHEDALEEYGVVIQSLVMEARLLAQPVSFEIASSMHQEGIEDRATMAPLAARRLAEMVSFGERIAAIELVIASQALDLKERKTVGQGVRRARDAVRKVISFLGERESIPRDLEALIQIAREEISKL